MSADGWRSGGASADSSDEEGRAFYQERLTTLFGVGFLISTAFLVSSFSLMYVNPALVAVRRTSSFWTFHALHLGVNLVALAGWLFCRRGERPLRTLRAVDVGAVLVICLLQSLQALWVPVQFVREYRLNVLLALTYWLSARATVVPSSPRRTFWISAAGLAIATAIMVGFGLRPTEPEPIGPLLAALWVASCAVGTLAVAATISWVIYGLRKEARNARRLGQYILDEKLGEGGMGVVYRARHAFLRRPTAIKLLPPDKLGEAALRRFEREVQITASLSHPNTVAVFDYGRTPDGVFYYAMEYLDGVTLERLVEDEGAQSAARVVHILCQAAAALAEAHERGLIHRDIKPANIILCERGGMADVAKVLDFGLVREAKGEAINDTNITAIAGTPFYLSPEAIASPEEIDARSDIYSLGAVGYYLLVAAHVFEGRSFMEVCGQHLHMPPPPLSLRAGRPVPHALEAVILACLEKEPGRRPQTAKDLRQALLDADAGSWSEEDARVAWARTKARPPRARPSPPSHPSLLTATFDDARLGGVPQAGRFQQAAESEPRGRL